VSCLTKAAQGSSALDQLLEDTQSIPVLEGRPCCIVNSEAYILRTYVTHAGGDYVP